MSQENLEVLRTGVDAWNEGDMAGMLAIMDPEIELVTAGLFPGVAPLHGGHEGWMAFWGDFRETWEALTSEPSVFRATGDQVVLLFTFDARGRSGLELHRKFASVWTFRNALVVKVQGYGDWRTALEAVGLSE